MLLEGTSQAEQIRAIFSGSGGEMSIRQCSKKCFDDGLFDESQTEGFILKQADRVVKNALKSRDEHGLSFAYNVRKRNGEDGLWKLLNMVNEAEAVFIMQTQYIDKIGEIHARGTEFAKWCRRRAFNVPELP